MAPTSPDVVIETFLQPVYAAKKRAAETIKRIKAAETSGEVPDEVPYGQVRSMFQGRLQSIMLQNRKQCRLLFRKWDPQNQGNIPVSRFHEMLTSFGVDLSLSQSAEFMSKFVEDSSRISFNELFFGLMGLPIDFFTMNLTAGDPEDDIGARSDVKRPLPRGTSFGKAEKLFKTGLRKQLFNVENTINVVFERASNQKSHMDRQDLWTMLNARGLMVTDHELSELMTHFDLNCDGRIDYSEIAHEMLRLPKPSHVRGISSCHRTRPKLSGRCQAIVKRLREMCERASAPPASLYGMFTRYDADGSGKIAYDEIVEMTRDTGTNVEGRDMSSEFLDKFSRGEDEITYNNFIIEVLGLQPDALRSAGATAGPSRPATAALVEEVSEGVKRQLQRDPLAIKRVFTFFDKDDQGTMRWAEFHDGVKAMGLPITRPQIKTMFKEFDKDGSGELNVKEFARDVLGIDVDDAGSGRSGVSSRLPSRLQTPNPMEQSMREGIQTARSGTPQGVSPVKRSQTSHSSPLQQQQQQPGLASPWGQQTRPKTSASHGAPTARSTQSAWGRAGPGGNIVLHSQRSASRGSPVYSLSHRSPRRGGSTRRGGGSQSAGPPKVPAFSLAKLNLSQA